MVQRRLGNGSALYDQTECRQVLLTLDVMFRSGRVHVFTCFGLVSGGAWLISKASGRLAGMRGPATRLKRDVRPVLDVISDGRRVCVRDGEGSVCVLRRKYCLAQAVYGMSEQQRKANSTVVKTKVAAA